MLVRIPLGEWGIKCRDKAITNGCTPVKDIDEDGDVVWRCGCDDECHNGDQQCSIISPDSAEYRRD